MDKNLRLEWMDPKTLKPNPHNWRTHPERQKKILDAMLSEVGWAGVALWNEQTGRLIDGHARREWAIAHGEVMPVLVGSWSEAEERKILATLDPIADMAEQADEIYRELLKGLETKSDDMREWVDGLLEELDKPTGTDGLTDPDEVPDVPEEPITKPGDLWILGEHRLLCGDSTKIEDVSVVLSGSIPFLCVTDPPYGVNYDPNWRNIEAAKGNLPYSASRIGKVLNDDRDNWKEAWDLFPGDVLYSWHPAGATSLVHAKAIQDSGFVIRMQIIWAKSNFPIGRGDYHVRHEPCWYAVRKGRPAQRTDDRTQTTLWQINLDKNVDGGHSTQKPVECMARPIRNHEPCEVYDPFLGSGTTLIACEQLGRMCYGMEIDPHYCDVIVKRWENFTGKKAVKSC